MTIETEIAALTEATTDLLDAVNVSKATLDASVAEAEQAVADIAGVSWVGDQLQIGDVLSPSLSGQDGTNVTITVAADQAAFDAATPGATELVVLYA